MGTQERHYQQMRHLRAALVSIVIAFALSGTAFVARASAQAESDLPGWIVFASDRDGDLEIYKKRANGSGRVIQLTHNRVMDYSPTWGPGARRIAFVRRSSGDIYTMWADGSHVRQQTRRGTDDMEPAWSPDGSKIAYGAFGDDGGDLRVLTLRPERDDSFLVYQEENSVNTDPTWSPDGGTVAFIEAAFTNDALGMVPSSGGSDSYVELPEGSNPDNPRWAPESESILYGAQEAPGPLDTPGTVANYDLFVMAADGSSGERLEEEPFDSWPGDWSPDERFIVFYSDRLGNSDIFFMNMETREVVSFVSSPASDMHPDWAARKKP